jgi:transcriptional regulator with XRE-family HTH domain
MGKSATDIDKHVAKRLKAARLEAGVLQEEAAAHLAVAYQQIHNYEKSRDRITSGKLAILAEVYGKPVQWFFEGAPKPLKNGGLSKERRDIAAEFMATPFAPDLARDYLAIQEDAERRVVALVASTIARKYASLASSAVPGQPQSAACPGGPPTPRR